MPPGGGKRAIQAGTSTGDIEIEHTAKDGTKKVTAGTSITRQHPLTNPGGTPLLGMAGSEMAVTIPGPKGSYKSVRIGAVCYLPCGVDKQSVQKAMTEAAEHVQKHLEELSSEAHAFLNE
jgi:hypothetical protein